MSNESDPILWKKQVNKELKAVGRETISMWKCAINGRLPPTNSVYAFGIDTLDQVLAIGKKIAENQITPYVLEDAKQSGEKLTKLFGVPFITLWDMHKVPNVNKET